MIVDSIPLHSKWYHLLTNAYIYLKSLVVGAKPVAEILEYIDRKTIAVEKKTMALGVYTLIKSRTPQ